MLALILNDTIILFSRGFRAYRVYPLQCFPHDSAVARFGDLGAQLVVGIFNIRVL